MQREASRDLVSFYYAANPPLAHFIARHETSLAVVREAAIDQIVAVVAATDRFWLPGC